MEKINHMENIEGQDESSEISKEKTVEMDETPKIKGFKHGYL